MKRIVYLFIVLISVFAAPVNAEIKSCPNENYDKISSLSFDDKKKATDSDTSEITIEGGVLKIHAYSKDPEVDRVFSYTSYGTFISVGSYYSVQGEGILIVYALNSDGKVYNTVVDLRQSSIDSSYNPELKDTGLSGIKHIATSDQGDEFYLIEKPEYVPHLVVYAIDDEGNIYTDETMENDDFCKIANPNPDLGKESQEESNESIESTDASILKQNIEIPVYIVASLAGVFGIVIGFLIGRIRKKENN